jgi:hypothetical protein
MIRLYTIMLFLHVSGDIGLFISLGAQLLILAALRRAKSTGQVRAILGLIGVTDTLAVIGALMIIATGLYMAVTAWGLLTGWIIVALGSLMVVLPPLVLGIIEPRMRGIVALAKEASDGPLPGELEGRIHDPLLATGLQTEAALILGIVFLMTNKPALAGSLLIITASILLGLTSGLGLWRAARMRHA